MTSDLIITTARRAICEHFAPRRSIKNGRDITHHESVEYVRVEMSARILDLFLRSDDKPTEVDGVPLMYAENPAPGVWDLSMMCYYRIERLDRIVGSRGTIMRLPDEDFS